MLSKVPKVAPRRTPSIHPSTGGLMLRVCWFRGVLGADFGHPGSGSSKLCLVAQNSFSTVARPLWKGTYIKDISRGAMMTAVDACNSSTYATLSEKIIWKSRTSERHNGHVQSFLCIASGLRQVKFGRSWSIAHERWPATGVGPRTSCAHPPHLFYVLGREQCCHQGLQLLMVSALVKSLLQHL